MGDARSAACIRVTISSEDPGRPLIVAGAIFQDALVGRDLGMSLIPPPAQILGA